MSILDRIRKLFGGEEIPEDAARIYRLAKSEEEALEKLEAERGRADRHRQVLIDDVKALTVEEERLLDQGDGEASGTRRRLLAKQVAEVRSRIDSLLNRVDLLTRRVAIFDRHTALVRDRAVLEAPLPEQGEIEEAAGDALAARRQFEEVEDLTSLHRDVTRIEGTPDEERKALRDLEGEEEEELSFRDLVRREERKLRPERNGGEALTE